MSVPVSATGKKRLRKALWDKQGGHCAYCGEPMTRESSPRCITIDHVVPLKEGGADDESNIVGACHQCNRIKGCLTASQLRRLADRIDELSRRPVVRRLDPSAADHVVINPALKRLLDRKREGAACNEWMIKLNGMGEMTNG